MNRRSFIGRCLAAVAGAVGFGAKSGGVDALPSTYADICGLPESFLPPLPDGWLRARVDWTITWLPKGFVADVEVVDVRKLEGAELERSQLDGYMENVARDGVCVKVLSLDYRIYSLVWRGKVAQSKS